MKKRIAMLLILSLAFNLFAFSFAQSAAFTEKAVPVIREDGETDAFTVRFYPDQPNVPYCGLRAYSEYLGSNPLTCETGADGTLIFTGTQGVKAVVDPKAGTLSTEDWTGFHCPAPPYAGQPVALKDSNCAFVRIADVTYEEDPRPLTLDFGKYGLRMYADADDVYLSLTLVSSLLCDISTRMMTWNGERARFGRYGTELFESPDMESAMMQTLVTKGVRPEDVAEETFAELCFDIDNFFGHPGVAVLDAAIAEKGLKQALLDLGEAGEALIEELQSTRGNDYLKGMDDLFLFYLNDGHTYNMDSALIHSEWTLQEIEPYDNDTYSALMKSPVIIITLLAEQILQTRAGIWGEDVYRECGNTAIIRLDGFMPDEAGWQAYYGGEGELPQDGAGIVVAGLRKAAENPDIQNVLFDLSYNEGGSSDVLAFIAALSVGADRLYGVDKLTGRRMTVTYEADTNLDGAFDARDREAVYDRFRYGVLTTREDFSCGNLFPVVMQEKGAALLGEPSGGGSCTIQIVALPDGTSFIMSSGQWQVTDKNYVDVEGGCKTDIPIATELTWTSQEGIDMPVYDNSAYYDDEKLNALLNDWFATNGKQDTVPDAA